MAEETRTEPAEDVVCARPGGGAQKVDRKPSKWTAAKRESFLVHLAETANVHAAARAVGLDKRGAYHLRRRDLTFRKAWDQALCEGYAVLETLLLERAIAGLQGPDPEEEAPATDAARPVLQAVSERTMLTLLHQHRQTVRDHRQSSETAEAEPMEQEAEIRARLVARLEEMRARLTEAA
jgi:hypothetical protein